MAGWGASCISINLDQWKGESGIKFAFETYSNFGNPLFIDNITVSQYVGQEEIIADSDRIEVYPNPASGQFKVLLPEGHQFDAITLVNHLGQVVFNSTVSENETTIEIKRNNNWTSGIYYLKTSGKNHSISKKVIIY
jgi:hypothetical protein